MGLLRRKGARHRLPRTRQSFPAESLGEILNARRGQTLVEVVIAILLVAFVTASIFIVILTVQRTTVKSNHQVAASYAAQKLLETLKNYVTADASTPALGPGGSWSLPGDTCNSCGGSPCYALTWRTVALPDCSHAVTGNQWFATQPGNPWTNLTSPPYNMKMSYTVTDESGTNSLATLRPRVTVAVNWAEPQ